MTYLKTIEKGERRTRIEIRNKNVKEKKYYFTMLQRKVCKRKLFTKKS